MFADMSSVLGNIFFSGLRLIKYNFSMICGKQAIRSNIASLVKSALAKITTLKGNSIAIGDRLASNLTKN